MINLVKVRETHNSKDTFEALVEGYIIRCKNENANLYMLNRDNDYICSKDNETWNVIHYSIIGFSYEFEDGADVFKEAIFVKTKGDESLDYLLKGYRLYYQTIGGDKASSYIYKKEDGLIYHNGGTDAPKEMIDDVSLNDIFRDRWFVELDTK